MIVEQGNSQVNSKSYLPFIAIKNGLKTTLTSDGLIDLSKVKTLNVPAARYDYLIRVACFAADDNGVVHCTGTDFLFVNRGQTQIDINKNVLAKLDAELFEKEV